MTRTNYEVPGNRWHWGGPINANLDSHKNKRVPKVYTRKSLFFGASCAFVRPVQIADLANKLRITLMSIVLFTG